MPAVITLTTDFGLADWYVGAMKGAILGVNPDARIVDISHMVPPQNLRQAAFLLSTVCDSFPPRTIHVVVVDPGVGTGRKAVILRTERADFVAPDNGVLSYILRRHGGRALSGRQVETGPGLEAVAITNPKFWRWPVSSTFHGRDIFAPVAALLSLGVALDDFGERLPSLTYLSVPEPVREAEGVTSGEIVYVDWFGNLVTNIGESQLPGEAGAISVEVGKHIICGLSRNYQDGKGLLALIGSSGYLEISLKNGSARKHLKTGVGDKITVRPGADPGRRLLI